MKKRSRLSSALGAAILAVAALTGLSAAPASATEASPLGICEYEYGGRCVTWVTNLYTCHHIFQTTTSGFKHQACTIWAVQGIVTVIP